MIKHTDDDAPRPLSSFPLNRELRRGETPCSVCGSGRFSHHRGQRGHEFVPWSQAALIQALRNAEAPEPAPAQPQRSAWMQFRHRLSLPLIWLAANVGGWNVRRTE